MTSNDERNVDVDNEFVPKQKETQMELADRPSGRRAANASIRRAKQSALKEGSVPTAKVSKVSATNQKEVPAMNTPLLNARVKEIGLKVKAQYTLKEVVAITTESPVWTRRMLLAKGDARKDDYLSGTLGPVEFTRASGDTYYQTSWLVAAEVIERRLNYIRQEEAHKAEIKADPVGYYRKYRHGNRRQTTEEIMASLTDEAKAALIEEIKKSMGL